MRLFLLLHYNFQNGTVSEAFVMFYKSVIGAIDLISQAYLKLHILPQLRPMLTNAVF